MWYELELKVGSRWYVGNERHKMDDRDQSKECGLRLVLEGMLNVGRTVLTIHMAQETLNFSVSMSALTLYRYREKLRQAEKMARQQLDGGGRKLYILRAKAAHRGCVSLGNDPFRMSPSAFHRSQQKR